eukprot:1402792-Prorocentrum_lima.AAC.1
MGLGNGAGGVAVKPLHQLGRQSLHGGLPSTKLRELRRSYLIIFLLFLLRQADDAKPWGCGLWRTG